MDIHVRRSASAGASGYYWGTKDTKAITIVDKDLSVPPDTPLSDIVWVDNSDKWSMGIRAWALECLEADYGITTIGDFNSVDVEGLTKKVGEFGKVAAMAITATLPYVFAGGKPSRHMGWPYATAVVLPSFVWEKETGVVDLLSGDLDSTQVEELIREACEEVLDFHLYEGVKDRIQQKMQEMVEQKKREKEEEIKKLTEISEKWA